MKTNREYWINSALFCWLWGISLVSWLVGESMMFHLLNLAAFLWVGESWREVIGGKFKFQLLMVTMGFALGVIRMGVDYQEWIDLQNKEANSQSEIVAQVVGLPEQKTAGLQAVMQNSEQRFVAIFQTLENIKYGDQLSLKGSFLLPNDKNLNINQKIFLYRKRAEFFLKKTYVNKRFSPSNWGFLEILFQMREQTVGAILSGISEPAASLISGILIGESSSLPEKTASDFQKTGLTHVLAISGFNITLIINLVVMICLTLSKFPRFLISLFTIWVFVVFTGASASVVRAGVMGILALLIKTLGRRIKPIKLILLSTSLIVLFDPRILNFDLSFQLSLLATLSLIWFSDSLNFSIDSKLVKIVWEGMLTTLAAQFLTLPLTFYYFGKIPIVSPISNLLIGPTIPWLMILGTIYLLLKFFLPILGGLMAGAIEMLVMIISWIVAFLAKLPGAQIEFGQGQIYLAMGYYFLLFRFFRKRKLVLN